MSAMCRMCTRNNSGILGTSLCKKNVVSNRSDFCAEIKASEDRPRLKWARHLEFVMACIGFAVGLGNVWRFPYLCFKNGGGVFLIPYIISLVFMGIPLFCLEIVFGQFASLGPLTIWSINPLFKGLGFTMLALVAILSVYYNVVVAHAVYFLFASMQNPLPWTLCGESWNTCFCHTGEENSTFGPNSWHNATKLNCSGYNISTSETKSSSEEYYQHYVLARTSGIQEPGKVKWDLTMCNLFAWAIIAVCIIKGVKTMGKAAYFFSLFPYILLTALLIRGVTLDGASNGIKFYLYPNMTKLMESGVWRDAASQIFFSLSTSTGSLTAMASYNKFQNNALRDSILIPIINCMTSFYAGFAIFSILGYMAHTKNVEVKDVTDQGTGLVYVAYPEALAKMPLPQMWSVLFFLMMICLGLGTQIPSVETLLTALQDEYRILRGRRNSKIFRVSVCILGFLLGIPQTTEGGSYMVELMDIFVGFPLLLVGLLQFVAIVWIYGIRHLTEDVMLMVGHIPSSRALFYRYFRWTWLIAAPLLIMAIIVFEVIEYRPVTVTLGFPQWAEVLGWLTVTFIMMWVPVWFLGVYCLNGGFELYQKLSRPNSKWGPMLAANRSIIRYQRFSKECHVIKNTDDGVKKPTPAEPVETPLDKLVVDNSPSESLDNKVSPLNNPVCINDDLVVETEM